MSSKRNLILIMVLSGALLTALHFFFTACLKNYGKGSLGKINSIITHTRNETITIWGASTAYVHVDPVLLTRITGWSAFNLGLDGVSYDQYKGLLNYYASKSLTGKKVIIAINIQEFHERSAIKDISNYLHVLKHDAIYDALADIDRVVWKARYVPFYALTLYDKDFFLKILDIYGLRPQKDLESYGFKAQNLSWQGDTLRNESKVTFSEPLFQDFTRAVQRLEKQGASVYIVLTPCYAGTRRFLTGTNTVIKKLQGLQTNSVFFLNFYDHRLTVDQTLFYNNFHLNQEGAILLTELIASEIKQNE